MPAAANCEVRYPGGTKVRSCLWLPRPSAKFATAACRGMPKSGIAFRHRGGIGLRYGSLAQGSSTNATASNGLRGSRAAAAPHDTGTAIHVDLRPYEGAVRAYMHNGVFRSLEEVVRFYNTRDALPTCDPIATRTAGASAAGRRRRCSRT
jgi:hypothetical protein